MEIGFYFKDNQVSHIQIALSAGKALHSYEKKRLFTPSQTINK